MSEQSGCDPMAAVNARLRHLLVENPSVEVDPLSGAILLSPDLTEEELVKWRDSWIKLTPRIGAVITQPVVYIPFGDPGDETDAA